MISLFTPYINFLYLCMIAISLQSPSLTLSLATISFLEEQQDMDGYSDEPPLKLSIVFFKPVLFLPQAVSINAYYEVQS